MTFATEQARVLGVDLAQRYSAAVVLERSPLGRRVVHYSAIDVGPADDSSWYEKVSTIQAWAADLRNAIKVSQSDTAPDWAFLGDCQVFVEDVPPRVINAAPALRLQGAMLLSFANQALPLAHLTRPNIWQHDLGYTRQKGRTTKGWAKELVEIMGAEFLTTAKATVDVRDAFLIAHFGACIAYGHDSWCPHAFLDVQDVAAVH